VDDRSELVGLQAREAAEAARRRAEAARERGRRASERIADRGDAGDALRHLRDAAERAVGAARAAVLAHEYAREGHARSARAWKNVALVHERAAEVAARHGDLERAGEHRRSAAQARIAACAQERLLRVLATGGVNGDGPC
jgi:hypothetical protein